MQLPGFVVSRVSHMLVHIVTVYCITVALVCHLLQRALAYSIWRCFPCRAECNADVAKVLIGRSKRALACCSPRSLAKMKGRLQGVAAQLQPSGFEGSKIPVSCTPEQVPSAMGASLAQQARAAHRCCTLLVVSDNAVLCEVYSAVAVRVRMSTCSDCCTDRSWRISSTC
jgi:hypothetical protein